MDGEGYGIEYDKPVKSLTKAFQIANGLAANDVTIWVTGNNFHVGNEVDDLGNNLQLTTTKHITIFVVQSGEEGTSFFFLKLSLM